MRSLGTTCAGLNPPREDFPIALSMGLTLGVSAFVWFLLVICVFLPTQISIFINYFWWRH